MSVIKWREERFIFVGNFLADEDINHWLEAKGSEFLISRSKKLFIPCFRRKERVKNKIRKQLQESTAKNSILAKAITQSLCLLPEIIDEIAIRLKSMQMYELCLSKKIKGINKGILVLPRGLVGKVLIDKTIFQLKNVGSFAEYQGLSEVLLARLAKEAEEEFFSRVTRTLPVTLDPKQSLIVSTTLEFSWPLWQTKGHYYYGFVDLVEAEFHNRRNRNEFSQETRDILRHLEVQLGRMSKDELLQLCRGMKSWVDA